MDESMIRTMEKENMRKDDLPDFRVGDTVRVMVNIVEGEKKRMQSFQGVVIRIRGAGLSKTFTVRKVSHRVGVERTFPLNSPTVEGVEIIEQGKVRRSKLYYLRGLRGKKAKVKARKMRNETKN